MARFLWWFFSKFLIKVAVEPNWGPETKLVFARLLEVATTLTAVGGWTGETGSELEVGVFVVAGGLSSYASPCVGTAVAVLKD